MDFEIRHVEAADVPQVFNLWRDLVAEELATYQDGKAYPSLDLDEPGVAADWFARYGESLVNPDIRFWVAVVDGHPVGFLVAYEFERMTGFPKRIIHVGEMYVAPAFRQKFLIAKALEAHVELWAKELKVEVIECSCVATEKQMNRWMRKGFTPYQTTMYRFAKWRGKDG